MDLLLTDLTLIDGTGRPPLEHAVIAIHDEKIVYAGPSSGWPEGREDVMTLDLEGQFALPGLIELGRSVGRRGSPTSFVSESRAGELHV